MVPNYGEKSAPKMLMKLTPGMFLLAPLRKYLDSKEDQRKLDQNQGGDSQNFLQKCVRLFRNFGP